MRRLGERIALRVARRLSGNPQYVPVPTGKHPVLLDQPPNIRQVPRWGWGRPPHPHIEPILREHSVSYRSVLDTIRSYGEDLAGIDRSHREDEQPCWDNEMCPSLDGATIYTFLRERKPNRYVEIGSGYSTKFAAQAKKDGDLPTEIISVDPKPRQVIDALCDRPIRQRLEDVDLRLFGELEQRDVVFFDGSHRVFMNNDVSTFFMDVLPALPVGVLAAVHDVLLPDDYGPDTAEFHWNEQYMLGAALLNGDRIRPVFPCHYVSCEPGLKAELEGVWRDIGLDGVKPYGAAFWFEPTH